MYIISLYRICKEKNGIVDMLLNINNLCLRNLLCCRYWEPGRFCWSCSGWCWRWQRYFVIICCSGKPSYLANWVYSTMYCDACIFVSCVWIYICGDLFSPFWLILFLFSAPTRLVQNMFMRWKHLKWQNTHESLLLGIHHWVNGLL